MSSSDITAVLAARDEVSRDSARALEATQALAVPSHVETDLILGTGAYRHGAHPTTFVPPADGDNPWAGWGYLADLRAPTSGNEAQMTGAILATTSGALVWLAGYAVACWIWPFAACRRCQGTGKQRSPTGKAFRLCRRCKATGRRIRTGRRTFNWLKVLHSES